MIRERLRKLVRKVSERYEATGLWGLARCVFGRLRNAAVEPRWPQYDQREIDAITEVLKSRTWGGHPYPGKHAAHFARAFAKFHDAKHGICCNSGTTALVVALKAAGVGRGDEVLVPALTFVATATAALEVGAKPIFVDVHPDSWCIDHRLIASAISERTKAIIPVHLGCRMADMDEICRLAGHYNLKVIEDAAHMHGGKWRHQGAGSLGDLGCFSFQNNKTMTAGEGGIVLTNEDVLATRCNAHVNIGRLPEGHPPQSILGSNLRITEFQAAILTVQLQRLQEQLKMRAHNYTLFDRLLDDIEGVVPLKRDERVTTYSGYGYYFKYFPDQCGGVGRDRFLVDLEGYGIVATSGFQPVYQSSEYGWRDKSVSGNDLRVNCPVAESAAYEQAVWLLHQTFLAKEDEVRRIAKMISGLVNKYRK